MFNATKMVPGTAVVECITVTYSGDVTPSPVEIGILVAGFALVAFLYTLAERYLDLTEPVHEPAAAAHAPAPAAAEVPA